MKKWLSILLVLILGTFITIPVNANPSFTTGHVIDVEDSNTPPVPSVIKTQFTNTLYEEVEETLSNHASSLYSGENGYPVFPTHIDSFLNIDIDPFIRPPEQA